MFKFQKIISLAIVCTIITGMSSSVSANNISYSRTKIDQILIHSGMSQGEVDSMHQDTKELIIEKLEINYC